MLAGEEVADWTARRAVEAAVTAMQQSLPREREIWLLLPF
jgi:hypothetical protein